MVHFVISMNFHGLPAASSLFCCIMSREMFTLQWSYAKHEYANETRSYAVED